MRWTFEDMRTDTLGRTTSIVPSERLHTKAEIRSSCSSRIVVIAHSSRPGQMVLPLQLRPAGELPQIDDGLVERAEGDAGPDGPCDVLESSRRIPPFAC